MSDPSDQLPAPEHLSIDVALVSGMPYVSWLSVQHAFDQINASPEALIEPEHWADHQLHEAIELATRASTHPAMPGISGGYVMGGGSVIFPIVVRRRVATGFVDDIGRHN